MSTTVVDKKKALRGGEFVVKESIPADLFIPEDFNEEQLMVRQMVDDFIANEIQTIREKIDTQEDNIGATILDKAAELGLLGTHMPMQYGGMEMDTNTNTLICERLGPSGAWNVTYAVQTGIGMLPIYYFGTEEQKNKYLPKMITGELKGCYCLTEPSSGSDALAAKTIAKLTDDGNHYILNGQKMWISNSGYANILIVFAQLEGAGFSCFIVERDAEGVSFGAEEDKLGIKGSSTRQIFLENVKIPKENLLGEAGKGHLIAFNVLNIGRFKLGAMCVGGSKAASDTSIKYANERHQFKKPIASFGAIKYKLAEQAIRVFASESALYRTSELMSDLKDELREEGKDHATATLLSAEEYAIECAIIKVLCSEVLDYVVDENVQIHGGIGFSEEYTAARAYRDSRINRIYEGTNEINRLVTVKMLLKRAMKGNIDLTGPAWEVQKELASMPSFETVSGEYAAEIKAIGDFKKILLMVAGAAVKMQMDGKLNLEEDQEIIMNIANIIIDVFTAESTLLRIQKINENNLKPNQEVYDALLKVLITDTENRIQKEAKDALSSFAEDDLLKTLLMGLKRFTKYPTINVKKERRIISDALCEQNGYFL